ncbi:MAG TPA: glycoside hydrolase family 20 zincin-like fold domain-containing protein, partial [Flavitalea sp.]|nr:glycoside hydrolase family 20 zincin-like fold domain-containing protein [Flavitalea sp.]
MYIKFFRQLHLVALVIVLVFFSNYTSAQEFTLNQVSIVSVKPTASSAGNIAAELLRSEVGKRTGLNWSVSQTVPATGDVIMLKTANSKSLRSAGSSALPLIEKAEAYRIYQSEDNNRKLITVEGFDDRGVLFGAAHLLRIMGYQQGAVSFNERLSISTAPDKGIRGHQLGYRNTANSYDGWTKDQFEQYIRDLVVFGTNSIESIP